MSMNENDQFDENDDLDPEHEEDDAVVEEAPKKNNNTMMIGAVAAVLAVFGFVGFQIYGKFVAKPSTGIDQSMMAPPSAMQPAVQPVMPADAPAPVGQPAAAQLQVSSDVGSVQMQAPIAPAGGPGASSVPAIPADHPVGQRGPVAASPAPLSASSPIDMTALNGLKKEQEAQSKRIDSVDDRLAKLEARIAQINGSERPARAARAARVEDADDSEATSERRVAKKARADSAAKKALLAKKRLSKKEVARQAWLKKVAARKKVQEELVTVKKSDASSSLKLPPAPVDAPKSEVKPEAPKQPLPRITGLRVQAVIPGRAWIQDDSGVTRSFAIGDSIKSGVVVKSIDADKGVVETSIGSIR